MKAVMVSIQPKWCELIATGKKTVEVRKTKIPAGTKVYIYQTKKHWIFNLLPWLGDRCGKVIGEFVCNEVHTIQKRGVGDNFDYCYLSLNKWGNDDIATEITDIKHSCVNKDDLNKYGESSHCLYAWCISGLKLYDKPRELNEFDRYSEDGDRSCEKGMACEHEYFDYSENCKACRIDFDGENCPKMKLQRPPQSWCYVEEIEERQK